MVRHLQIGQGLQRAKDAALLRPRGALDQRGRGAGGQAVRYQLAANHAQRADAHVNHHGLARPGQRRPVQRHGGAVALALQVAGGDQQRASVVAVRQRHAQRRRCALRRADAGHGVAGNAGSDQGLGLFAAPAKNVGIAPF